MTRENDDYAYMGICLDLARQAAEQGEVPVGAIVVMDGQIVGRGYNLRETTADPTAHAEVIALRKAAEHIGHWRLIDRDFVCHFGALHDVRGRLGQQPSRTFGVRLHGPQSGCRRFPLRNPHGYALEPPIDGDGRRQGERMCGGAARFF